MLSHIASHLPTLPQIAPYRPESSLPSTAEPRCASILSRNRQTPPILTSATPVSLSSGTGPRSASALGKMTNFSTPPVERRNTVDVPAHTLVTTTLPSRPDLPLKTTLCGAPEAWSEGSPNGSTSGNPYVSMPEITTSYV